MRKLSAILLAAMLILSLNITAFAAENPTEIDVYAKVIRDVEGEYAEEIKDGEAEVETDDGTIVSVTDVPEGAVTLMVVPVPATETAAWEWIAACMEETGTPIHTFDIYFVDQNGNRINANGAVVTINCPHCSGTPLVCSLATSGAVRVLSDSAQGATVTFTADGSHYYVMAEKAIEDTTHRINVVEPDGGEVTVSTTTPKTGETVTITVKPDDDKTVDQVKVTDESGKAVTITDNGEGTYTFTQPDGDVTVEVTFKDKAPAPADEYEVIVEKTSGGKVEISDDTPVAGQTVTITPKPNSGKVVKKVTVTDENGKSVKVTDNGDGTYSFVQPDSDVTVKVTFKNKPSSGDLPQTGDTMCLHLWILILLISGMMLIYIGNKMRKQEAE